MKFLEDLFVYKNNTEVLGLTQELNSFYVLNYFNNNVDNILTRNGSVDYLTGDVDIEFVSEVDTDLIVDYVHNETNIAVYKNLSTQTFYFDASSLVKDDMQDLV